MEAGRIIDLKVVKEGWTEPAVEGVLKPQYRPDYVPADGEVVTEPENPDDKYEVLPKPEVIHGATVQLIVSDGKHPADIEADSLRNDYRNKTLEETIALLVAPEPEETDPDEGDTPGEIVPPTDPIVPDEGDGDGEGEPETPTEPETPAKKYFTLDRDNDIVLERSNEVAAGLVIRVERNGDYVDGLEGGAIRIYVSDGPTDAYIRAQLFNACVNLTPDEARAKLEAAGYEVDDQVDRQAHASIDVDHVVCIGLVQVTEVNGEKVEEVVTGDEVSTDIKRARLIVSSGPETAGDGSGATSKKVQLTPSWSKKDPAAAGYDANLADGTYPSWYLMPSKLDGTKYLTGDAQSTRFTNYSTGSNDGHHYGHSDCWGSSVDETSGDLAIGYKSQGSFLVDFRQVDTTPQTNLGNITYHPNWHSGYDPNPARAAASSVAPETTFFMEQGNSNFYATRCPGCYSNWSYYDKNSRWVYGTGFYDNATYRDKAGNIDDQYHYHSGSNYYGNHFCYDWAEGSPRFNSVGSYTYNTGEIGRAHV